MDPKSKHYQPVVVTGFDEDVVTQLQDGMEVFAEEHADTLRLVACYGTTERHDVQEARVAMLDPLGLEFATITSNGDQAHVRLGFSQPVSSQAQFVQEVLAAIGRARSVAPPDEPLTRLERERAEEDARTTLVTRVARTREVSPNIREITFAGGLEAYTPRSAGEFITVLIPRSGHEDVLMRARSAAEIAALPEEQRPLGRSYTTRAWRPESGEIDVWFVLHDHRGGLSDWARQAQPDTPVALRGPRVHLRPPQSMRQVVLLGDETFFPATVALLEQLDPSILVAAFLETVDEAHELLLPTRAGMTTNWLHRHDAPAGTTDGLLDAVQSLALDEAEVYIAGAGESEQMKEIRRYLRRERGIPNAYVNVVGYWHRESHH